MGTTGTGIGDGNTFQLLTKFIVIITQCSWCVPGCAANCATCDPHRRCTKCNEGYIVKADKLGCDGKSICIETVISRWDYSSEVFEDDTFMGGYSMSNQSETA